MPPIRSTVRFVCTNLKEMGNHLPVYGFEVGLVVAVGLKVIVQCVWKFRNNGENIDVNVPAVACPQPVESTFADVEHTRCVKQNRLFDLALLLFSLLVMSPKRSSASTRTTGE